MGLLLGLALILGRLSARLGLAAVVGEMCTGILVGPSVLGHAAPRLRLAGRLSATSGRRTSSTRPSTPQLGLTLNGAISANGDAATQASQIQTTINQHVNATWLPLTG